MCKSFKGMAADSLQYGDHRRCTRRKEGQPGSALGGHETVNKALLKPVLEGGFISSGVCQDVTYRFQHGRLEGSDEVVCTPAGGHPECDCSETAPLLV